MKKFFVLLLIGTLLISISTCALSAVHNLGEEYPTDTWYTITPQNPYWQLFYSHTPGTHTNSCGGEFFQNEQTFFQVHSGTVFGGFKSTSLTASYLLDCGFFIGVADYSMTGSDQTTFAPGYRFSFDENSYAALSLDYSSSAGTNEVAGYELDARYYTDKAKLSGNVYLPAEGDATLDMEIAYAVSDRFVIGGAYSNDGNSFSAGCTYTAVPAIVDFKYYNSEDYDYCNVSGMFKPRENYGLGLQYFKYSDDDDPKYTLVFKYSAAKGDFKLLYTPEIGNTVRSYSIAYYEAFK